MCSTVSVTSYHYGTLIKARNESYPVVHTSLWKSFYLGKHALASFQNIRLHNLALFLSTHVMISPLENRIRGYPTIRRCWQPSASQCMTRGTLQFDASFIHYSAISDVRRVLYGVKIKTARARVPSQEVGTNQPAVANVRLVKTRSVYFVDFCGESKQHVGIWGNGLQLH
jgi:hypothetical protein